MGTRLLAIDPRQPAADLLAEAARIVKDGGLVAFPTETVYGLGADALNGSAVRSIFEAKGRPADNPLIVHIASMDDLLKVSLPTQAQQSALERLAEEFWPGPLTVVLPKNDAVPKEVTAGLNTVAVRMPAHPVALGLIAAVGRPIAAPSANRSGRPSPTEASHVKGDLDGRIPLILDGGPTEVGLESTVLDLTATPPLIHRPGSVTVEQIRHTLQTAVAIAPYVFDGGAGEEVKGVPLSPGIKYEHYAPRTRCILVDGPFDSVMTLLRERIADESKKGKRVGLLLTDEGAKVLKGRGNALCVSGSRGEPAEIARHIYRCLRNLDEADLDIIYIEGIAATGVGAAVMNRLSRAAGHRILRAPTL